MTCLLAHMAALASVCWLSSSEKPSSAFWQSCHAKKLSIQSTPVCCVQVHASAHKLKLITFDADGTLYADGTHMEADNQMISHIISLMRSNVHVAIVTAAG